MPAGPCRRFPFGIPLTAALQTCCPVTLQRARGGRNGTPRRLNTRLGTLFHPKRIFLQSARMRRPECFALKGFAAQLEPEPAGTRQIATHALQDAIDEKRLACLGASAHIGRACVANRCGRPPAGAARIPRPRARSGATVRYLQKAIRALPYSSPCRRWRRRPSRYRYGCPDRRGTGQTARR